MGGGGGGVWGGGGGNGFVVEGGVKSGEFGGGMKFSAFTRLYSIVHVHKRYRFLVIS